MSSFLRFALSFALALSLGASALAHPGHDEEAHQDPALLAAVVALGGGADKFSAATLRNAISANVADEDSRLRTTLGSKMVDSFDDVFTFVVRDGVRVFRRSGNVLPSPRLDAMLARDVARAMLKSGTHDGTFDVERLFDTLFSRSVHTHAMVAVAQKYGSTGETAYHVVFARLVQDVGGP